MDTQTWKKVLDTLRPIKASIEILLRAAKPLSLDGEDFKIGVYYKFHKEQLEEFKNRQILENVLKQVLKKDVNLCCVLHEIPVQVSTEIVNLTEPEQDITSVAEEIFSM